MDRNQNVQIALVFYQVKCATTMLENLKYEISFGSMESRLFFVSWMKKKPQNIRFLRFH